MKITLKNLKGAIFHLEISEESSVRQLKELIEQDKGEEYYADGLKVIYSGKILKDEDTIASIGFKENSFVVVMPGKPRAASAPKAAPMDTTPATPAPAAAPAQQPAASQVPATPAVASTPAQPPAMQPRQPQQSSAFQINEAAVQQLCDMGFPRPQVEAALRAAFNNPDRAAEYLMMGGVPSGAGDVSSSLGHEAMETEEGDEGEEGEEMGDVAGDLGSLSPESPIAFLASNPNFLQLRNVVQQQPNLLPALLRQLAERTPEIVDLINQNQEDFYILLNMTDDGAEGGMPPGPPAGAIQVTQEEKEAIDRLCGLGFDRNLVIQAYFACDKNETLAANFLMQNAGMD